MKPGMFVRVKSGPNVSLGIGKVSRIDGRIATVRYFDGPGHIPPPPAHGALDDLSVVEVPIQSRVYRQQISGRWQVGRVLESGVDNLYVQFPNQDRGLIPVGELEIRWARPLIDPLPLLISEATETPFLANARSAFVRRLSEQRSAAAGLTAALSSSIELVDYQFDVVRRILTDPVQRYLLADEVGLGKTIEACIVIRQYFLDEPATARALVIVPAPLVEQWRTELATRFGLLDELDENLQVLSAEALREIAAALPTARLLVVDEAHHLSKSVAEQPNELYDLLKRHAPIITRLLLLSATPVLSDDAGFLRILHLLDPIAFPLDDLAGFRNRIATREIVAEVVAMLSPENLWSLAPELDRLEAHYASDDSLMDHVKVLRAILAEFPDEENEAFIAALQGLRIHLIESYRLHRRMLRNRRALQTWATPRRDGVIPILFSSARAFDCREALEYFRLTLNAAAVDAGLVGAALLEIAVHPRGPVALTPLLDGIEASAELLSDAQGVDEQREQVRNGDERFMALVALSRRLLASMGAQLVVFCDTRQDADRAAQKLAANLGATVVRHDPEDDQTDSRRNWRRFLADPQTIRILVCDARAEEGLNLHGGRKIAIFFDLPPSPNRIEQRLGRLDRYGSGDPIVSYALIDSHNPDESAWLSTLSDGWGVFDRSVASLQYLIEDKSRELTQDWLAYGTNAIRRQQMALAGADGWVAQEIARLNRQDALDALDQLDDGVFDALHQQDNEWQEWRTAFHGYASGVLGFSILSESNGKSVTNDPASRLRFVASDQTRPTLLPLRHYLDHFLQSIDVSAEGASARSPQSHPYVFRRQSAVSREGLARGRRLLRVGDPLVRGLEEFCARDDRGRAFAVWRYNAQYQAHNASGTDLFFRFDFIVSASGANLSADRAAVNLDAVRARKASIFMPPLFLRIWVSGATGQILDDPDAILTAAYRKTESLQERDFNLNPSRWRQLPSDAQREWTRSWSSLCEQRRADAERGLLISAAYRSHMQKAVRACEAERKLRRAQSASRLMRSSGGAEVQEREDLARDDHLYTQWLADLSHPTVALDVVGAVFVSDTNPFAGGVDV